MTVRNQNGQPLDPLHNTGEFQGYASEIIVTYTTVVATFDHDTRKTTINWHRPESDRIVGEVYDIYRKPIFTPNIDGNYPITHDLPDPSAERIAANLPCIPAGLDDGSHEYDVVDGTEGWYFYALVIKYQLMSAKVIPDYGVWESNVDGIDAPDLIVVRTGHKKVELSWTAISNTLGYKVFYCTKSMADNSVLIHWKEPPINAPLIVGTSTIVTGLENNVRYYFRVRAVNTANHEGPFSNEVNAMPLPDSIPPDRVTNFTATDLGIGGTVRVCWTYTPPSDLKNYRIYYFNQIFSAVISGLIPYVVAGPTDICINVTGLENTTQYWFAVVPVDEADNYYADGLYTRVATPTRPSKIGYSDPITITVNNEVTGVTGIPSPHVIYGFLQLPLEYESQINLEGISVTVTVTLSSLGGLNESLNATADADGFWSVNLANLKLGEWRNNDLITVQAKDWNSPFLGSATIHADTDLGSQRVDILLTDSSLQPPVLITPITGKTSEYPIFKLYSVSQDKNLKFKIEVSDDNFRTILRVFDETSNTLGWSRDVLEIGGEDKNIAIYKTFQNDRLVNGETYQWRAYSFNGIRFSMPSNIAQFGVVAEQLDKSSEIWSFNIDAEELVQLWAVATDTGRFEYPNADGIIITDSTPTLEWKLIDITVHNVHFRLEIDTDPTFSDEEQTLKVYESKDEPDGFEYSFDRMQWFAFTRIGAPSGVQYFRYVFKKNLEVV